MIFFSLMVYNILHLLLLMLINLSLTLTYHNKIKLLALNKDIFFKYQKCLTASELMFSKNKQKILKQTDYITFFYR